MKFSFIKVFTAITIAFCLLGGAFSFDAAIPVSAAKKSATASAKPARASFTAKVTSAGDSVKFYIDPTDRADGYRIYMKAPRSEKYSLAKTLRKDGSVKRSYTLKKLSDGVYSFKVRAYRVIDGKKVFGSYSPALSIEILPITDLPSLIARTPELLEFSSPMQFLVEEDASKIHPCNYGCQLKRGSELPVNNPVYRLYAIDYDEKSFIDDTPVPVDSVAMSVTPCMEPKQLSLMIFAFASEEDAARRVKPIARTARLDIQIGEQIVKYADITFKNGYAYFGSYPQSKVSDKTLSAALDKAWTSCTSQILNYKGENYIYSEYGKYWCKSEPVEWIILDGSADSDTVTLMSSKVLLECGYSSWDGYEAGGLWKDSFVRNLLNGYNAHFKNIWTFDFFNVLFEGDTCRVLLEQSAGKCNDKVLLPSKDQLSKLNASQRILKASDLAIKADKKGYWCIDSDGKGNITAVDSNGKFTAYKAYSQDGQGYVPVIKVDLKHCNIYTK